MMVKKEFRISGKAKETYESLYKLCRFENESYFIRFLIKEGMKAFLEKVAQECFANELNRPFKDESGRIHNPMFTLEESTYALVKIRDKNSCKKCGSKEDVEPYHIDGNKENRSIENLMLLCVECKKSVRRFIPKKDNIRLFILWFYFAGPIANIDLIETAKRINVLSEEA